MKEINPTLIIGLGGTGQWILTYVKSSLQESLGSVPPQIRLLTFDTTSEETEVLKGESAEESARVGQVYLDSGEFVYLGGNIKRICKEIQEGRHAHIGKWFQAGAYLGIQDNRLGLSDDDFNLARGAGTRRPFGRMAIFYDLISTNQSKVRGKIHDALQSIVSAMDKPRPVEVYVVCSLAGGTGSGMFIDVAHLSRLIAAEQVRCEVAVRGFLVLHNTFQSVLEVEHVMPNAFAAVRELDRFMTVFGEAYPIDYTDDPNRRELRTVYSSKLFDSCFLLDAERAQKSLRAVVPKYGVYPSVAHCITAFLDPDAGDTFQQHYKNVNNRMASSQKQKGVALYSSLGTYSYILPSDDILQSCVLRFAYDFVKNHFAGLVDAVIEDDAFRDARGFLQQGASHTKLRNTSFMQGVALKINRDIDDPVYITQIAANGLDLIEMLRATDDKLEIQEMNRRMDRATSVRVIEKVKTSEEYKDSYENAAARIPQQIEAFRQKYLDELKRACAAYSSLNLVRFQNLLQEQMELVFSNIGPLAVRSGQLGYAQAFLTHLVQALYDFARLVERARTSRNNSGELVYAREEVEVARRHLETTKAKDNIVDRFRKLALNAQRRYIDAAQYLIDLEIEEFVYAELIEVTNAHCQVVQALLDDVNRWIAVWTTGDVVQGETCVVRLLQDAQAKHVQQRQEKNLIPTHRYVTDSPYEQALYDKLSDGKIEHLLGRLQWACERHNNRLGIELTLDGEPMPMQSRPGRSVPEANYDILLQTLYSYFADVKRETVASRLVELYTADSLAQEILDLSAPMIRFRREDWAASDAEFQTFVAVDRGNTVSFWEDVEKALKHRSANIKDIQIIPISSSHRCAVISTVDLIGRTAIQSLSDARDSYDSFRSNRKFLHIFSDVINAIRYEEQMHDYPFYEPVRHFRPRVLTLLENDDRLRLFVLAYALGVVIVENGPEHRYQKHYTLRVNRARRSDQAFEFALTKPAARPSIFEAIHTFTFQRLVRAMDGAKDVIVSVDGRFFVESKRVDAAIGLREYSIKSGLEYQVQEFERFLRKYPDLRPHAAAVESEFRRFAYKNTYEVTTLGPDELTTQALNWLDENYDIVPRKYHDEIANRVSRILLGGNQYITDGEDPSRLLRRFQGFLDETVSPLKDSANQDEKDLGVIMHIIAWDYMQRLEQK